MVYSCNYCVNVSYAKIDSYRNHMRKKHKENFAAPNVKCTQDDCSQSFFNISAYRNHLAKDHSIAMIVTTTRFLTEKLFLEWKKDYEQENSEKYVKNTGVKDLAAGKCETFYCYRSGFDRGRKPFAEKNRIELLQGSAKLNGRCPSQMIVVQKSDFWEVTHHSTRTHEKEVQHFKLSDKTCETIAAMIKCGFSHEHILKHYKTKPTNDRDHWVEEKDLRQIADRHGLTDSWRLHFEDAKSVHLFVERNPNIVLFYQPEVKEENEILEEFILVLQTERQVKYIQDRRQFRVICTDSTHNVGAKKKMATLMTVDEDEEGVVLATCICQYESTATMQIFFAAVRDKVGFKISTDSFVTNDANAFYNAWCAEMTTDTHPRKRLCAWHVNKNWTTHFSQVPDEPIQPLQMSKKGKPITKRQHCKTKLYALRTELDVEAFKTKMIEFLAILEGDSGYTTFKDYFKKYYENRAEQWAYAYLSLYGGYNTNMYLESWHAEFKKHYLNGIQQKRLDFVLEQLIIYDKNEQEEEERRAIFGRRRNKRSAKVLKCHKLAVKETRELKYQIIRSISTEGKAQFTFVNGKVQIVVTEVFILSCQKYPKHCVKINTHRENSQTLKNKNTS